MWFIARDTKILFKMGFFLVAQHRPEPKSTYCRDGKMVIFMYLLDF